MKILSIESVVQDIGRRSHILRFQQTNNGDVDVVESYSADDNYIRTRIPKDKLVEVADFLKGLA